MPTPPSRQSDQPPPADAAAATETTPLQQQLQPFFHDHPLSPPPDTYIIQVPKDQVLRVPPPDRSRRYKKLAGRPARRRLLRRACCFSCAAVLLLLLLAAAVYLVFRPRTPSFTVSSLSIRGLDNLTAASSPELDAAVRPDNDRNRKVGVDYRGGGSITISYAGVQLATGRWPAFLQPPRNETVFEVAMRGQGVRLTEDQARQLAAELTGQADDGRGRAAVTRTATRTARSIC